jgi:SM-20-related protein
MDPLVINNFLPQQLFDRLLVFAGKEMPLSYGSKSNSQTDPHGHLSYKPLHDEQQNLADLSDASMPLLFKQAWEFVRTRMHVGAYGPFKLLRAYVNGYSYGLDGYAHTDSAREQEWTCIIFLCDQWHPDWGGETLAWRGERIWAARPAPNRAMILPSNLWHRAASLSRKCNLLRLVLVLKFRQQRSAGFEHLSSWLVRYGALQHEHASGTLHDHLMRVYQLLAGRNLPAAVCVGGGLHAIYGTNAFKQRLSDANPFARAAVAGEWGREAEELAYNFSILDRPVELERIAAHLAMDHSFMLRCTHNASFVVDQATARALCLIECANLEDQGSLEKWRQLSLLWNLERDGHAAKIVGVDQKSVDGVVTVTDGGIFNAAGERVGGHSVAVPPAQGKTGRKPRAAE